MAQKRQENSRQQRVFQQQQTTQKQNQRLQPIQVAPSFNFGSNSEENFQKIITTTQRSQQQSRPLVKQTGNFRILQQVSDQRSPQQQQVNKLLRQQGNLKVQQTIASPISSEQITSQQSSVSQQVGRQSTQPGITLQQQANPLLQQRKNLKTQQTVEKPISSELTAASQQFSALQPSTAQLTQLGSSLQQQQILTTQQQQLKQIITDPLPIQTTTNKLLQQHQSSKFILPSLTQNSVLETGPIPPIPSIKIQKTTNRAQPPGVQPPNNSVIEQLNNAENFLEIVEKLKLRQALRGRRLRRQMAEFFAQINTV